MPTMPEAPDLQRPRILRLYNLYRVILGFGLTLLTSSALRGDLLEPGSPQLFDALSWLYLLISVLIALFLHRGLRDLPVFLLCTFDILLLGILFYAAGGAGSGFGNLLIIPVAVANILLHGRIGLLLPAIASLLLIYLTFFISLAQPGNAQSYLQAGVLGCIYFAVALFVQRLSRRLQVSESLAQAQAASLANLEQLNQLIIQRMRTGIMVIDAEQQLLLANEACAQLLGKAVMQGVQLAELAPELEQRLQQWRHTPSARSSGFRNHVGGAELMANFKLLSRHNRSVLIFLEDNTQVAQQAQQLKLASLGRLTASIAHEIRNPLGAISHAAQLLQESEHPNSQDKRLLDIIQQQSRRMNGVIETVLELSRRRPSEPQLIDLAIWLHDYAAEFRLSHPPEDNLCCAIDREGITTRFDPNQLTQIVNNLCQNALRYSPPEDNGQRRVYLNLYQHADTDKPVLEVIDHGPGVAEDQAAQIFEPFYTTESSGTGLGLYICRELCESNQAQLEYAPVEPTGSCMRITFAHPKRLV